MTIQPLRAVIFDFGGVFMKTLDYTPRQQWDARLGLPAGSVERVVHGSASWRAAQSGTLPVAEYWADVAVQLNLSAADVRQLERDFFSGDVLDTDLVAYARRLKAEGLAVGLLSNDSPVLLGKLERLGLFDLFRPLVVSALIGVMKPDPRSYQAALAPLGFVAGEVAFVDDMPANIVGAEAVGMRGVQYINTQQVIQDLESLK